MRERGLAPLVNITSLIPAKGSQLAMSTAEHTTIPALTATIRPDFIEVGHKHGAWTVTAIRQYRSGNDAILITRDKDGIETWTHAPSKSVNFASTEDGYDYIFAVQCTCGTIRERGFDNLHVSRHCNRCRGYDVIESLKPAYTALQSLLTVLIDCLVFVTSNEDQIPGCPRFIEVSFSYGRFNAAQGHVFTLEV